jgi:hypothetical protein
MAAIADHTDAGGWLSAAAYLALLATVLSAAALLALHMLSHEFAPSWRMVSEYANGAYPWLLTIVFFAWAIGSLALIAALWPLSSTALGKVGLIFLALAGLGQVMGGLFDINHKLHGPAAMIGIPSLCIAAVLVSLAMARRADIAAPPIWSAHLPWISFGLMIASFALFFSALKAAGVDMSGQTPLKELPAGVNGYVGWANRLIFLSSYLWTGLVSWSVLKAAP